MPTLVIDKLTTAEIIKLKSDLGDEIQKYVLSLKRDLDLVINGIFEHTKVELDEKRTKIEIQNECNRLVSKYHSDLLRFERHANSSKKYNIERAFFSVIFPTALGIIIGGDIGTILAGFSRVGSLGIPDLKITPSQLARQKVIYDISKRF